MNDTAAIIRRNAAAEWPTDFSMQRHEIEQQTEAAAKMDLYRSELDQNNPVVTACMSKAMGDWPENFSMQVYEFENQLDAATNFFSYENPSVPKDVFDGIKQRAFSDWPGDYSMMHYELTNQIEAWLSIHG